MQQLAHPPARPSAPSLLAALRTATAPLHQAVEHLPAMARLTAPGVTPADYRRYLLAMARVYGDLEPPLLAALQAALPGEPVTALGLRPKLPALHADLARHGLAPPAASPEALGHLDLSTAIGGLYCLEGATLGGRVIARHLRRHLGDPLPAEAFLDFHGDSASAAWKRFGRALDELAATDLLTRKRVIDGACTVFRAVYNRLAAGYSTA